MVDGSCRPDAGRISRRDMMLRSGASLAAVASERLFNFEDARAEDAKPRLVLGTGPHRYECVHDWLVPPDGLLWGDTQGVAQDSRGNIYVTHTVAAGSKIPDAIVVFDKRGRFLKSWGSRFRGGGHGIEIRREGRDEYAYHCDTAHRLVVKTDLDGNVVWEKGAPQEPGVYRSGAPYVPTNIAFAPHGDFYVADGYGSNWIHHYTRSGDWVRTWGGTGTEDGKFHCCHGIWLDNRQSDPLLAVTDRESRRIQFFDLDGKFVKSVSEGIRRPCYFDTRGGLMLVSDLKGVVQLLDRESRIVAELGDGASLPELRGHPRSDYVPGKFIHPHGGKFLKNGDILIAEWLPDGRLTLLRKI